MRHGVLRALRAGKRELGVIGLRYVGLAFHAQDRLKFTIEGACRKHDIQLFEIVSSCSTFFEDVRSIRKVSPSRLETHMHYHSLHMAPAMRWAISCQHEHMTSVTGIRKPSPPQLTIAVSLPLRYCRSGRINKSTGKPVGSHS